MNDHVTTAVKAILADDRCEISAELVNELHGCCASHPLAEGKSAEQRKMDAIFAVAQAKYVPAKLCFNLERTKTCTS